VPSARIFDRLKKPVCGSYANLFLEPFGVSITTSMTRDCNGETFLGVLLFFFILLVPVYKTSKPSPEWTNSVLFAIQEVPDENLMGSAGVFKPKVCSAGGSHSQRSWTMCAVAVFSFAWWLETRHVPHSKQEDRLPETIPWKLPRQGRRLQPRVATWVSVRV
jgi:hypothetical protein